MRFSPGLQGLRGVAILLVVAYHVSLLPGGWIGVDLFFALSGFLITRLLVEHHDLKAFYLGRMRRLVPALVLVLAGALIVEAVVFYQRLDSASIIGTVTFTMNFNAIGDPSSPLVHLWSLAEEEQFYLLWPLLLYAVRPGWRIWLVSVLALCSFTQLHLLSGESATIPRLYYGPDTHALPLLLGCVAALSAFSPGPRASILFGWSGAGAMLMIGLTHGFTLARFEWALLLGSVAATLLVLAALRDPRLLCGPLLQRLGLYSYGIYLWHLPLIIWLPNGLAVGLALVLAALSYHLVELPIRRGRLVRNVGHPGRGSGRAAGGAPEDVSMGLPSLERA